MQNNNGSYSYSEVISEDEISLEEAMELTREHRKMEGLKQSPAFFIPIAAIKKLTGALGLDGIKIYTGYKNNKAKTPFVLVVGAVIEQTDGCELYADVLSYSYSINGEKQVQTPVILTAKKPPCPPPTDGCYLSPLNS
jgi:hypothetical protein